MCSAHEVMIYFCSFFIWTKIPLFTAFSCQSWFSNLSKIDCSLVIFKVDFNELEYNTFPVYLWSWILSGTLNWSKWKIVSKTFSSLTTENFRVFLLDPSWKSTKVVDVLNVSHGKKSFASHPNIASFSLHSLKQIQIYTCI